MAEYIERDAAIAKLNALEAIEPLSTMADAKQLLADIPAADVVPVMRGRWDDTGRYTFLDGSIAIRCTECGCSLTESEYCLKAWYYCPICGAKMDGEV